MASTLPRTCLFLLALTLLSAPVFAQSNFLEQLLDPFKGLNLETLYVEHAAFIDLLLYLVIFTGIAQVTLGRIFPGRGGRAIVAGVGISLALSLSISERVLNFNLRSFGPLAAGIIVLLVGVMLYRLIRHIGLHQAGSGAIAFVIVYFSLRAVTPSIFDWLQARLPFVNGLISLALIIALWVSVASFWPRGHGVGGLSRALKTGGQRAATWAFPSRRDFEGEEHFIHSSLARITKKERKTSREIQEDLQSVLKSLEEFGGIPQSWPPGLAVVPDGPATIV